MIITSPGSPLLRRRSFLAGTGAVAVAAAVAACGDDQDPFASSSASASSGSETSVVVGSQQYYSNEIIAELYAQAMENAGLSVTRQYQIGQREIYVPELESGKIQVIPEYGGNLLQYYDDAAQVTDTTSIMAALRKSLPGTLTVLDPAEASDQDSYTVTSASAKDKGLTSVADLTKLGRTVHVAANSEFATRPYGPKGLKETYGVQAEVTPVEDSGGPLTLKALTDGSVDVADLYTSDPAIEDNDLVVLEDPEHLILPQNVVPLVSKDLAPAAVEAINAVQAVLTTTELRTLNRRSTAEELDSATIARDWLTEQGVLPG